MLKKRQPISKDWNNSHITKAKGNSIPNHLHVTPLLTIIFYSGQKILAINIFTQDRN